MTEDYMANKLTKKIENTSILPPLFIQDGKTAREYKEFYEKVKPSLEILENNRRLYLSSKFRFDNIVSQ